MAAHPRGPAGTTTPVGDSVLAGRLTREIEGEVLFDPFSRGRYSTDASHYQIEPIGVVVPKTADEISRVIEIAADEGVPVLPRGGGTSQCGQTVGEAVVVDVSKHLNRVLDFDVEARTGISLTESMAIWPGASVSGWYFSHPQSQYFVVGRIARDQVEAYAERKGWSLVEAERWLSPNLGYDPED